MKLINIYGGCNLRMNVSCVFNNKLYFCSQSNILISDDNKIQTRILLENYLNFINVKNNIIISGDNLGVFYYIIDNKINKIKFLESIQNGIFLDNETVVLLFLKKIIIYNIVNNQTVKEYVSSQLICSVSFQSNKLFIGYAEGTLRIFNLDFKLLAKIQAHFDRIQDIKICKFNLDIFIATSSKDNTVKIWRWYTNNLINIQTLVGHNDWVFNINWMENLNIITASADKKIIEWKYEGGTWSSNLVFGGAKTFYNAFNIRNKIIGQSHSGAFYLFENVIKDFISGHTDGISSLDWNGEFLLSTSIDKTARIFHKHREVGRPVSHGYPLSSGKFIDKKNLTVILGAQESIIRIYDPTYIFYMSCDSLNCNNKKYFENIEQYKLAAMPAELSLTNDVIEDYDFENLNEFLLSTTTFTESKKIYGHYFNVSDIAVSSNYIASCNQSLTKKFAGIFLWDKKYNLINYKEVHKYGITRLKFSFDGKYLIAVSKDRTTSVYEIDGILKLKVTHTDHTRIIWDCGFSFDSIYYATCSRDKKVIIYKYFCLYQKLSFESDVTSLEFSPIEYLIIVGLETGEIIKIEKNNEKFSAKIQNKIFAHSKKVTCVKFNDDGKLLSSGGSDGLINVFEI